MAKTEKFEFIKTVEYLFENRMAVLHGPEAKLFAKVEPVEKITVNEPVQVTADVHGVSFTAPDWLWLKCEYKKEKATLDCVVY
jgi:hypothetical protein